MEQAEGHVATAVGRIEPESVEHDLDVSRSATGEFWGDLPLLAGQALVLNGRLRVGAGGLPSSAATYDGSRAWLVHPRANLS